MGFKVYDSAFASQFRSKGTVLMVRQYLHAPKIECTVSAYRQIEDKGPGWFTAGKTDSSPRMFEMN